MGYTPWGSYLLPLLYTYPSSPLYTSYPYVPMLYNYKYLLVYLRPPKIHLRYQFLWRLR